MTHLLWFLLGTILLIGIILLLIKAVQEGKESKLTNDWLYSEDEFSPENIDIMKAYKRMHLRNKLKEIEQERGFTDESKDE